MRVSDKEGLWWVDEQAVERKDGEREEMEGRGGWGVGSKQKGEDFEGVLDVEEVNGLLEERDRCRMKREYREADGILKRVYGMPKDGRRIAVDDTLRRWVVIQGRKEEEVEELEELEELGELEELEEKGIEGIREECLRLVEENDIGKVQEIRGLLDKFVGKEGQILKRLRERYGE